MSVPMQMCVDVRTRRELVTILVKHDEETANLPKSFRAGHKARKQQAAGKLAKSSSGGVEQKRRDTEKSGQLRPTRLPSIQESMHYAVLDRQSGIANGSLQDPGGAWWEISDEQITSGGNLRRPAESKGRGVFPPEDYSKLDDFLEHLREDIKVGAKPVSKHYRDQMRQHFQNYKNGKFVWPASTQGKQSEEALAKKERLREACTTPEEVEQFEVLRLKEIYGARQPSSDTNEVSKFAFWTMYVMQNGRSPYRWALADGISYTVEEYRRICDMEANLLKGCIKVASTWYMKHNVVEQMVSAITGHMKRVCGITYQIPERPDVKKLLAECELRMEQESAARRQRDEMEARHLWGLGVCVHQECQELWAQGKEQEAAQEAYDFMAVATTFESGGRLGEFTPGKRFSATRKYKSGEKVPRKCWTGRQRRQLATTPSPGMNAIAMPDEKVSGARLTPDEQLRREAPVPFVCEDWHICSAAAAAVLVEKYDPLPERELGDTPFCKDMATGGSRTETQVSAWLTARLKEIFPDENLVFTGHSIKKGAGNTVRIGGANEKVTKAFLKHNKGKVTNLYMSEDCLSASAAGLQTMRAVFDGQEHWGPLKAVPKQKDFSQAAPEVAMRRTAGGVEAGMSVKDIERGWEPANRAQARAHELRMQHLRDGARAMSAQYQQQREEVLAGMQAAQRMEGKEARAAPKSKKPLLLKAKAVTKVPQPARWKASNDERMFAAASGVWEQCTVLRRESVQPTYARLFKAYRIQDCDGAEYTCMGNNMRTYEPRLCGVVHGRDTSKLTVIQVQQGEQQTNLQALDAASREEEPMQDPATEHPGKEAQASVRGEPHQESVADRTDLCGIDDLKWAIKETGLNLTEQAVEVLQSSPLQVWSQNYVTEGGDLQLLLDQLQAMLNGGRIHYDCVDIAVVLAEWAAKAAAKVAQECADYPDRLQSECKLVLRTVKGECKQRMEVVSHQDATLVDQAVAALAALHPALRTKVCFGGQQKWKKAWKLLPHAKRNVTAIQEQAGWNEGMYQLADWMSEVAARPGRTACTVRSSWLKAKVLDKGLLLEKQHVCEDETVQKEGTEQEQEGGEQEETVQEEQTVHLSPVPCAQPTGKWDRRASPMLPFLPTGNPAEQPEQSVLSQAGAVRVKDDESAAESHDMEDGGQREEPEYAASAGCDSRAEQQFREKQWKMLQVSASRILMVGGKAAWAEKLALTGLHKEYAPGVLCDAQLPEAVDTYLRGCFKQQKQRSQVCNMLKSVLQTVMDENRDITMALSAGDAAVWMKTHKPQWATKAARQRISKLASLHDNEAAEDSAGAAGQLGEKLGEVSKGKGGVVADRPVVCTDKPVTGIVRSQAQMTEEERARDATKQCADALREGAEIVGSIDVNSEAAKRAAKRAKQRA